MKQTMKLVLVTLALCQILNSVSSHTALIQRQQFSESDFVFGLLESDIESSGTGGTIQVANIASMPALAGTGISYTLFNINPCAINLPHLHPRATELIYVISGSNLTVGFTEENGGRFLKNVVNAGDTTFFPQGLIHYQHNFGCETVQFISALNSVDPGVVTVANNMARIPAVSLQSSLGLSDNEFATLTDHDLPAGPAPGLDQQCMQRCGLDNGNHPGMGNGNHPGMGNGNHPGMGNGTSVSYDLKMLIKLNSAEPNKTEVIVQ